LVVVGAGGYTIGYTSNGTTFLPVTTTCFTVAGYAVTWSPALFQWIVAGDGLEHTLGYSYNGLNFAGLGKSMFSVAGLAVSWSQTDGMYMAGGIGTINNIATSFNGLVWTGRGIVFNTSVTGVAYSKVQALWVAVGCCNYNTAYSSNLGVSWTGQVVGGFTSGVYPSGGASIVWSVPVSLWVMTGYAPSTSGSSNAVATSADAITWTRITSAKPFDTTGTKAGYDSEYYNGTWCLVGGTNKAIWTTTNISGTAPTFTEGDLGNAFDAGFAVLHSVNFGYWYVLGSSSANTIGYSSNACANFTGLGKTLFTTQGNGIAEALTAVQDPTRRNLLEENRIRLRKRHEAADASLRRRVRR
jgi:hypothetical protein